MRGYKVIIILNKNFFFLFIYIYISEFVHFDHELLYGLVRNLAYDLAVSFYPFFIIGSEKVSRLRLGGGGAT